MSDEQPTARKPRKRRKQHPLTTALQAVAIAVDSATRAPAERGSTHRAPIRDVRNQQAAGDTTQAARDAAGDTQRVAVVSTEEICERGRQIRAEVERRMVDDLMRDPSVIAAMACGSINTRDIKAPGLWDECLAQAERELTAEMPMRLADRSRAIVEGEAEVRKQDAAGEGVRMLETRAQRAEAAAEAAGMSDDERERLRTRDARWKGRAFPAPATAESAASAPKPVPGPEPPPERACWRCGKTAAQLSTKGRRTNTCPDGTGGDACDYHDPAEFEALEGKQEP